MTEPTAPTDFGAAAAVVAALKDLPKPRQELVLRWVAESLGITVPQASPAATAPAPSIVTSHSEAHHHAPPAAPAHPMDIAAFVAAKQPKTDIQFVTVVAYYRRFLAPEADRLKHITIEVAQDATRLANWDRLTNPGSTLNNARNQGYLDRVSPGKFAINTVGENLVARTLPSGGGDTNSDGRKRTSGKKKTSAKRKTKTARLK